MNRRRRGFTMVELLVVIAIIAVLAAILFPVFARAKAAAKQTACVANLKQIGDAISLYMSDYDGIFPDALDASDRYAPQIWEAFPQFESRIPTMPLLNQVLQTYLKSAAIFHCPSDTGTQLLDSHPDTQFLTSPSMYQVYGSSYFFRTEIAFRYMSDTSFQLPSNINVLFDGAGHWHGSGHALQASDIQNVNDYLSLLETYRYNTLFGDFHVKSLSHDALMAAWTTPL